MRRVKAQVPGVEFSVLGEWYAPFDMMLNDLGFWYPILLRTGVPTPRTIIVNADNRGDRDLVGLLDGVLPEGLTGTLLSIRSAMREVGFPCFFRGGQTSAKHDWKRTCFVEKEPTGGELAQRMSLIVERCVEGNIGATPLLYENWVVRQLITTTPFLITDKGMPVVKEARFFLKDGKIDCWHPYWPKKALEREGNVNDADFDALNAFSKQEQAQLTDQALAVAEYFPGYWSCDFLLSSSGVWYCTDMARGEDSYHLPECARPRT